MTASVFPPSGGGSGFEGYKVQYVDPAGNNSSPGTVNSPKKTISSAYAALAAGGTIYCGKNSQWSDGTEGLGLTAGQGRRLTGFAIVPPGFLALKQCTFEGYGYDVGAQLGINGTTMNWGHNNLTGSALRSDPCSWIVGGQVPVTDSHLYLLGDQVSRTGWDYRRNENLTVMDIPITLAARVANADPTLPDQTTFTMTLPTHAITSFARAANVVTVKYSTASYPVALAFAKVTIAPGSLSADFPPGDFTIIASTDVAGIQTFTYSQVGANKSEEFPVGATFATSGAVVRDTLQYAVVEVVSTDNEFPSTMYVCSGVGPNYVVVDDFSGYGTRHTPTTGTHSNIGILRLQLRHLATGFDTMDNCILSTPFGGGADGEKFSFGPTVDRGDGVGGDWAWMRKCYLAGSINGQTLARQSPAKSANIFAHGVYGANYNVEWCQTQEGAFYVPVLGGQSGPGVWTVEHVTQDTGIGTPIFDTVQFKFGNGAVKVSNVFKADASDIYACDIGFVTGVVSIINTAVRPPAPFNSGPIPGLPVIYGDGNGSSGYWSAATVSYEASRRNGWYASDGRLAGKRIDAQCQFGLYQGGPDLNVLPDDVHDGSKWISTGVAVTNGVSSPDGGTGAFGLAGAGTLTVAAAKTVSAVGPVAIGDVLCLGLWVRMHSGAILAPTVAEITYGDVPWQPISFESPYGGDGEWQYLNVIGSAATVANVGGTTFLFTLHVPASGMDIYQPTVYFLPFATRTHNEQARIGSFMRGRPAYIPNGSVGTWPGQKLFGHAGFGTNSANAKTVGVGSGQLTLTGTGTVYLPMYDLNGTTIIGWVAQLQATVNP